MPKLAEDVINDRSPTPESEIEDIPAESTGDQDADLQANALTDKILKTELDDAAKSRHEDNDVEEEEGEGVEDVYEVETIVDHRFVKQEIRYRVRWKGYTDADDTWEPEDNLLPESRNILAKYHTSLGGRPQPEKKSAKRKTKADTEGTPDSKSTPQPSKRSKRQNAATRNGTMSADGSSAVEEFSNWKPKESKWDDLIDEIETVERDENGNLRAYIRFKNGRRTKIGQNMYYQHCPRKMLGFYEKHLSV